MLYMYWNPAATTVEPHLVVNMVLGTAIWAEVLGVPVAWLRLRQSQVWRDRPVGVRRIDLLATFVAKVTALAAMLGGTVAISALATSAVL